MNEDTFLKENIVCPWVFNRQLISGSIYCFFVPLYGFLLRIVAVAFWPVTKIHVENLFTLSGGVPNGDCSVNSNESVIAIKLEQISMIVRNFRCKLDICWDLVLWKTLISWCSVYSLPIFFLTKQSKTKQNQTKGEWSYIILWVQILALVSPLEVCLCMLHWTLQWWKVLFVQVFHPSPFLSAL